MPGGIRDSPAARGEAAPVRGASFYRSLIDNATDLISLLSPDGTNLYVSPATERFLGYAVEEREGRNALELVHPEDLPAVREAFLEILAGTRGDRPIEFRFRAKSGEWRWLESRARNDLADPNVRGIVVHSRDVTERRRAEEQIRFQAHLLDAVGQAIIATDPDCRIRYMNQAAEALLGCSAAASRGRSIDALLPGRAAACVPEDGRPTPPEEFMLDGAGGSPIQVLATTSTLTDAQGRPAGSITVLVDITERKRTQTRLRENEERLQQVRKLESIGRLAGGMAHDFNNLLTGIRGFAQFAWDGLPEHSPVRADLEQIQRSADRAASLTRQLLAFGRKQVLQARVLDLNDVVRELDRMVRRLIGEDITISLDLAPRLWCVKADPGQIEQVLINLALNARDAMPTGGELVIATRNTELTEDDVRRNPFEVRTGPYVLLTMTDNGHGMEPDTLEHIFEPFFTTKPIGQGSGLGLSTAYGIVKQSGGYILADSTPGMGTTMRVYLPRVRAAPAEAPAASEEPPARRGNETVLLVEDDETVRALTRRVLRRQGYHVLEATNGAEALRIAAPSDCRIDLVLTDVVMPVLGGRQLIEQLRLIRPDLPVLLMSGYTDDAIIRHGITESGEPFLPKPFTTDALTRKVRSVLDNIPG